MEPLDKNIEEHVDAIRRINARLQRSFSWGTNNRIAELRRGVENMQRAQTRYLGELSHYLELKNNSTRKNPLVEFKIKIARENQSEAILERNLLEYRIGELERATPISEDNAQQIENIKNHALVASVGYNEAENRFVIITEPIVSDYTTLDGETATFELGVLELKWAIDEQYPRVRNLTRPYLEHPHPCVSSQGGRVCIGGFEEPIAVNARAKRYDMVVDVFLHYIRTLDSGAPYTDINNIVARSRDNEIVQRQESELERETRENELVTELESTSV